MGLFNTSLSKELTIFARTFNRSVDDICQLQRETIELAFDKAGALKSMRNSK